MNTTKKQKAFISIAFALILFLALLPAVVSHANADGMWDSYSMPSYRQKERLVDAANLLNDYEEEGLLEKLNEVSEKHQSNVAILTVYSHSGTAQEFADDYFDYNGFQADYNGSGVLFMLSMETREWAISTSGDAIEAITDYGQEQMIDDMIEDLSGGYYGDAFETYIKTIDKYLSMYEQGSPYDVNNTKSPGELKAVAIGSIVVGILVALFIVFIMAAQLTSVRFNTSASGYQTHSGIHMDLHKDTYLRSTTSRTRIQEESSGSRGGGGGGSSYHTSSSGSSHGGSSGHF